MTTLRMTIVSVACGLALLAPSVAAAAPTDYTDPTGDNGSAADIGLVSVQLAPDGYYHVRPTIAAQPALFTVGGVLVGFDTDRSLSTGGVNGADFLALVLFEDVSGEFLRWDGVDWVVADTQQGDVKFLAGASSFELLVRPAALGNVTSFNFSVAVFTGEPGTGPVDRAPDSGTWLFESVGPATVKTVIATWVPGAPKAGGVFQPGAVRLDLSDGKSVVADSYRCVAELAGKLLRGKGRGGCVFTLPKSTRGKRLKVTLLVTYKGDTTEFEPYVFKVR